MIYSVPYHGWVKLYGVKVQSHVADVDGKFASNRANDNKKFVFWKERAEYL